MSFFERWYDALMNPLERRQVGLWRKNLVSRVKGHVLEVGVGTGANLPYYPENCEVVGIEPSPDMREQALKKLQAHSNNAHTMQLVPGFAEDLPFATATFDTVVATLVLCSVRNPQRSVQEMNRVLKPGGTLLLLEHVAMKAPVLKGLQDLLTPAWRSMMGNCHLNRDTAQTVREVFGHVNVHSYVGGLVVELQAQKEL